MNYPVNLYGALLLLSMAFYSCKRSGNDHGSIASKGNIDFPDQLRNELADEYYRFERLPADTARIRFLHQVAKQHPVFDHIIYRQIAAQTTDSTLLREHISAYKELSRCFSQNNNLDSVTYYCMTGIRLCGNDSTCSDLLSEFYRDLGNINANFSRNADAIVNFEKAIAIAGQSGNSAHLARYIAETGRIYVEMNDMEKARECYQKGKLFAEKHKDYSLMVYALNSMGDLCRREQKYEQAINYHQMANNVNRVHNGDQYEQWASTSIGKSYSMLKKYDSARRYFGISIALAEKQGSSDLETQAYLNLSVVDYQQQRMQDAIRNALKAREVSEEIPQLEIKTAVADNLYFLYKNNGDFEKAIAYLEELKMLDDSLRSTENVKQFAEAEFKTKEDKLLRKMEQNQAIHEVETKRERAVTVAIACILLISVIFAAFIFRNLKQIRAKNRIIEEKQKEILESITYARRIQNSLLPSERYIERILNKLKPGKI